MWRLNPDDPLKDILARVTPESWRAKFPETARVYERLNPEPDFYRFIRSSVKMWTDPAPSGYPAAAATALAGPLLLVRGSDDPLVSEASLRELANRVAQAELVQISGAGHEAFKDQPAAFMQTVGRFLRE